jgi:hypothetical protein
MNCAVRSDCAIPGMRVAATTPRSVMGFVFGLILGAVDLILAACVLADLHDIVLVLTAVCRACFGVPRTPLIAHQIEAARHAPAHANRRHRNGRGERELRRDV